METTEQHPLSTPSTPLGTHMPRSSLNLRLRRRLVFGVRWLGITVLALALTITGIALFMHPSVEDLRQLAISMVATGGGSLLFGEATLWLLDLAHLGSVRLKLAVPPLLTAAVLAFNVAMLAQLMFITVEDSRLLFAFLAFGMLVALALSFSIAGEMSRAIARIELGARRIARGDYSFRLDESAAAGSDELSHLAHWFNQMAASVHEAFTRRQAAESERRQVIAAVSHDLRTPLSSVRAMIEAIDDGVVTDPATVRRYQKTIRAEVRHLSILMDDLFDLSRLESRALALKREWLDLSDILSDTLETLHEQAEQHGLSLKGRVDGDLGMVYADPKEIYRVLSNLLQNAMRHTPAGGTIMLRAAQEIEREGVAQVLVQVLDTGEGIAPADLPHIFERTYRGETSRRRESSALADAEVGSGAGLGLAIARGIVEMHGGHMWAVSPLTAELRALIISGACTDGAEAIVVGAGAGTALCFTLPMS